MGLARLEFEYYYAIIKIFVIIFLGADNKGVIDNRSSLRRAQRGGSCHYRRF